MDLAGYILICLIWGSTWLAIKVGLDAGVPALLGAACRFLLAGSILLPIAWWKARPAFSSRTAWRLAGITGTQSFCLGYGLNYLGGHRIPSGLSALTFGFFPFCVALMAMVMIGERVTGRKLLAIGLGICGVATLFWGGLSALGPDAVAGVGLVTLSVIVQAWGAVVVKRDGREVPTVFLNAVAMLLGSALLFAWAAFHGEYALPFPRTAPALFSIAYLAILGSICTFMIYYALLKRFSATRMAFIALITPPISVLLGSLVLRERLGGQVLLGGALILAGVALFARAERR